VRPAGQVAQDGTRSGAGAQGRRDRRRRPRRTFEECRRGRESRRRAAIATRKRGRDQQRGAARRVAGTARGRARKDRPAGRGEGPGCGLEPWGNLQRSLWPLTERSVRIRGRRERLPVRRAPPGRLEEALLEQPPRDQPERPSSAGPYDGERGALRRGRRGGAGDSVPPVHSACSLRPPAAGAKARARPPRPSVARGHRREQAPRIRTKTCGSRRAGREVRYRVLDRFGRRAAKSISYTTAPSENSRPRATAALGCAYQLRCVDPSFV